MFENDKMALEFINYKYDQTIVNFQRSYVCLEGNWWDQGIEFIPHLYSLFRSLILDEINTSYEGCDGPVF
jgi:hypothetical protein